MASLKTICWGWDSPLLDKAVSWLAGDWEKTARSERSPALDLSDTVVVTATAEAARRIREALAAHAGKSGAAVMAPQVWHPELCLMRDEDRRRSADRAQSLLAWIQVLQEAEVRTLPHLFSRPPPSQGTAWAAAMAEAMMELQDALGAGGLSFADAAASEHTAADRQRWNDLAKLEDAFVRALASQHLISSHEAKRRRSREPRFPPGVRRIAAIGVADAPPLFYSWLATASEVADVEVCIQAPESERRSFSSLGQPLVDRWGEDADVLVPPGDPQLHVESDSAAQAELAIRLLGELLPGGRTAFGVCDAETSAHLEDRLAIEGIRGYQPGSGSAEQHGFLHLAKLVQEAVSSRSWKAFAKLIRIPDAARAWCGGTAQAMLLRAADDFSAERLPMTLDHARSMLDADPAEGWQPVSRAVDAALADLRQFQARPLPDAIRSLLLRLYGERPFSPDSLLDRDLDRLATAWLRHASQIETHGRSIGGRLSADDALRLSAGLLAREPTNDPRGDIDLVLQGWLELLWEPSPNLIVLGCNEEHLPGILISHPFLPDHLRQQLGLPCQASRFARDAYLLKAMAEQRTTNGSLHLLCGQWSEAGDALRPSRLLFLCDDSDLPRRVKRIFNQNPAKPANREPPRTWQWKLKPLPRTAKTDRQAERDRRISASRLRDYIACPFRYYLKHELGMKPVETAKAELNAAEFGSLIHDAFKMLADERPLAGCTDARKLGDFLRGFLDQRIRRLFAGSIPLAVRMQVESARQRLSFAAETEAAHREAGWRTMHGEFGIGGDDAPRHLMLGGRRFFGRIDRIDRGPDGEILILDFKTRDAAASPPEAHLKKLSPAKAAAADDWLLCQRGDGKIFRWIDLQLPLYAKAWSLLHEGDVRAGYFHLPTSVQDTAIEIWDDLDAPLIEAATACGEEAVRRIERGVFWPPADRVRHDEFASLFAGQPIEEIIDPEVITKLAGEP